MEKTTIIIADDHTLVREAWTFTLNADPRFQVIAESGSGAEAIELVQQLKPQVVIMDINMPGMSGIEATQLILQFSPATRVLGISLHTQPVYARKMIQKGAMGYVTKNSPREEMFRAVLEVREGKRYICNEIKNILSEQALVEEPKQNPLHLLSHREIEVISFIRQGCSSKEIADALFISVKTAEVHRYNILRKLKMKNTAALVNFINTRRLDLMTNE